MTINQMANISSAYRSLYVNKTQAAKNVRNLSSGYKINSAADNAAGLAISEKMRGQIGGLSKASENAQQGVNLIQTAEGDLNGATSILQRMRELAVQASNGTYSDVERNALNSEFNTLKGELDRISGASNYNGMNLLDGSLGGATGAAGLSDLGISSITAGGSNTLVGDAKFTISEESGVYSITAQIGDQTVTNVLSAGDTSTTFTLDGGNTLTIGFSTNAAGLTEGVVTNVNVDSGATDVSSAISASKDSQLYFQIGANGTADQQMGIHVGDMSSFGLGISDLDIGSLSGANSAISSIDSALNQLNSQRSSLGAAQNRLEHTISNLGVGIENMTASESRIRDADMAQEVMNLTQRRIQMQAAQAMMAQGMNLSRQYMMGFLLR